MSLWIILVLGLLFFVVVDEKIKKNKVIYVCTKETYHSVKRMFFLVSTLMGRPNRDGQPRRPQGFWSLKHCIPRNATGPMPMPLPPRKTYYHYFNEYKWSNSWPAVLSLNQIHAFTAYNVISLRCNDVLRVQSALKKIWLVTGSGK